AGEHAERRALADTATGEDADALAFAAGQKTVDSPNSCSERFVDRPAAQRVRRLVGDGVALVRTERAKAIDRLRQSVDDAAQELLTDRHVEAAITRVDRAARAHAVGVGERHQDQAIPVEANDLSCDPAAVGFGVNGAKVAHGEPQAPDLNRKSDDLRNASVVAK